MKQTLALMAVCGSAAVVSAAAAPRTQYIAQQVGNAYDSNHGDVAYWKAGVVVGDHNDLTLRVSAATAASIPEMYNQCLKYCKAHNCNSFDLVFDKYLCYFDVKSVGDVLLHADSKHPEKPYEKNDPDSAYIKMKAVKPAVAPAKCFGFGLEFASGYAYVADTLPTTAAVQNSLNAQCGKDNVCRKFISCTAKCGAIAAPPDTKLRGSYVQPGVSFGQTRGEVKAKALQACQKVLNREGMDAECEVIGLFCFP